MSNQEVKSELPANFEELKKSINRTSNWRERLEAIDQLGQWDNDQTIKLLTHSMVSDSVYKVQEAAYQKLKQLGEAVQMPAKNKGELMKGINKILLRIKKSLPEDHTYEDFKEKFKKMRIDLYDLYEGNKDAEFDSWLEGTWTSLSRK